MIRDFFCFARLLAVLPACFLHTWCLLREIAQCDWARLPNHWPKKGLCARYGAIRMLVFLLASGAHFAYCNASASFGAHCTCTLIQLVLVSGGPPNPSPACDDEKPLWRVVLCPSSSLLSGTVLALFCFAHCWFNSASFAKDRLHCAAALVSFRNRRCPSSARSLTGLVIPQLSGDALTNHVGFPTPRVHSAHLAPKQLILLQAREC